MIATSPEKIQSNVIGYGNALQRGLRSRSAWKKLGVKIAEDATSVAYVLRPNAKMETVKGEPDPWELVIRQDGNLFLVTTGYFEVFSKPESPKKEENLSLPIIQATPASPASRPITIGTLSQVLANKGDTSRSTSSKKSHVNNVRSYVPEALEIPPDAMPYQDGIRYFLGLIHWKHVEDYKRPEEYIPLKAAYLDNQIPAFRDFWPLIKGKLVERDGYYVKGQKAYGYRLAEALRGRPIHLVEVQDHWIQKKVKAKRQASLKLPVHRHLREQLDRVDIDAEAFARRFKDFTNFEHYIPIVQTIKDKVFELTVDDFAGRCHTNLTRLYKPLRSLLRVDNQRLAEIDIRNSQPTFLGLELQRRGIPAARYIELVQAGLLYDHLAENLGVSREEAKEELLKTFYSKNGYSSPLKRLFTELFPEEAAFIKQAKAKDHRRLAQMMQKAEARFILHVVCERLRQQAPEVFIATIHDSILCKIEDTPIIEATISEEFLALGIAPKLKTTSFDENFDLRYDQTRERLLKVFKGESNDG